MKKILLTSLMIAFAGVVNAQLFVKDGSYVFMTNQYMTVMQDVNLNNTGNFYLRNTSQLLQKGAGGSVNTGTGTLSVFQEGTVNNFQYNYWCSPVGSGAAGNPFGISLLNRPTGLVTSTAAEILPTNIYNGTTTGGAGSTMQIAPYWIWKFVSLSPVYASWQYVGNTQTLNPGEGFSMKGTSGTDALAVDADGVANKTGAAQRYDFRGRPNDGNISVPVSNGNLTLVGNPYSSAINLNQYLVEHTGRSYNPSTGLISAGGNPDVINGTAYFWEHSKTANTHTLSGYVGGYGTYVANGTNVGTPGTWVAATYNTYNGDGSLNTTGASSGSNFKRQFSPIGQGFMVQGIAPGFSVMKNAYRVFVKEGLANESTFEKVANSNSTESLDVANWDEIPNVAGLDYTQISRLPVPQIKLVTVLNNAKSIEIAMAFNPNTTDDYDVGYDGVSSDVYVNAPDMVYFGQNNNDKKCVITTLPFDIEKRIPIAFKCAAASNFRVKVADIINFTASENVYIHDKETGIYFDIKNAEFNMNLPAGENTSRFEVTFKNFDALSNDNNNLLSNSFKVFQNNKKAMLTIVNTLGKDVVNCNVYDVTGKLVIAKKNLGSNNTIELPTNALSDGVYIVKLNTSDNVSVEKKIIIGN
jgi:hypothetical protein